MQVEKLSAIFAQNLRQLRIDRGWNQSALAREMSRGRDETVHAPYISDLERGIKKPSIETLARLSEVFGVDPSDLLAEKGIPEKIAV